MPLISSALSFNTFPVLSLAVDVVCKVALLSVVVVPPPVDEPLLSAVTGRGAIDIFPRS